MGPVVRQTGVNDGRVRARYDELKGILDDRRELLQGELRRGRDLYNGAPATAPPSAVSAADMQDEIQSALLEMKAETLRKIEEALAGLERNTYGSCQMCGAEIAASRLRALPFAARCASCEAARERDDIEAQGQTRRLAPLLEVLG